MCNLLNTLAQHSSHAHAFRRREQAKHTLHSNAQKKGRTFLYLSMLCCFQCQPSINFVSESLPSRLWKRVLLMHDNEYEKRKIDQNYCPCQEREDKYLLFTLMSWFLRDMIFIIIFQASCPLELRIYQTTVRQTENNSWTEERTVGIEPTQCNHASYFFTQLVGFCVVF